MEVVVVDSKTQAWIHRRPATHLTLHRLQRLHTGRGVDVGRVGCGQASEPGQDMVEIEDGVLRPVHFQGQRRQILDGYRLLNPSRSDS
jgi:hypothetical protein